jgi:mRNA interferase YafQ
LKKKAASKRAGLPRASDYTKDFLRGWQRLTHSGRYGMHRLKESGTVVFVRSGSHADLFR